MIPKTKLEEQIERIVKKAEQTAENPKWKESCVTTINGKEAKLVVKSDKTLTDLQFTEIKQVLSESTSDDFQKMGVIISLIFDGECTCSIKQWAKNNQIEVILVKDAAVI